MFSRGHVMASGIPFQSLSGITGVLTWIEIEGGSK